MKECRRHLLQNARRIWLLQGGGEIQSLQKCLLSIAFDNVAL
jgi:hypothetical protein